MDIDKAKARNSEMIKSYIKTVYFKFKYPTCRIMGDVPLNTTFEGYNTIWDKSIFVGKMGYGSYLGRYCSINVSIGRFCSIGTNVKTIISTHPSNGFVSTHPAFFSTKKQNGESFVDSQKFEEIRYADSEKKYPVIIGNDVWIGDNVAILGGITIGDGAIIGANAVVTHSVEPYAVVGGVPARVIRYRFDKKTIDWLLRFKWWDKSIDWIRDNAEYFSDIETFRSKYEEGDVL